MWLGAFIAFICLCSYVIDAHMRATRTSSCEWIVVPNPDDVPYFARWCKLTKDTVLLRLYDAKEQHLLAERTYFQLDRPNLGWAPNYFWYDSYPDDAFIELPPSIFERLRAKLP
jgi:hypothetical protein